MVRGERLPSALLKEALLHPAPLEREVEETPNRTRREENSEGQSLKRDAQSIDCVVQIPITEIIKPVDRQHI